MPALVVNLFHRGRPKPRLCMREPLGSDWTGPNQPPVGADRDPPLTSVDSCPPLARAEWLLPPGRVESHPLPARVVDRPPQVEVGYQQPQEVLSTSPQVGEEQVIVPGLTGMKCTCVKHKVGYLSPQGLHIWSRHGGEAGGCRSDLWLSSQKRTALAQYCLWGPAGLLH